MHYFDLSTGGFLDTLDYGERWLSVPDPNWQGAGDAPHIPVPNPACTLPPASQLVALTDAHYAALLDGHYRGQLIAVVDGQPTLVDPPPPTLEQRLATATRQREARLSEAALQIAPLQDAVDLGEATASELAQLAAWKRYRIALSRLDLAASPLAWPDVPSTAASPSPNEV